MVFRSPANLARWEDPSKRGSCLCRATNAKCRKLLRTKGLDGIVYSGFEPQFEPVSEATVSIPHMTRHRNTLGSWKDPSGDAPILGNFQQADIEAARLWRNQKKDGRDDWTAADVAKYRKANKLTWHERWDGHTMDLVPRCIHNHFTHTGGVAYMKWIESILAEHEYDPETFEGMPDSEYQPDEEDSPQSSSGNGGFCPLHLILTVGLLALLVVTFLCSDCSSFLRTVLCSVASLVPYVVLPILCLKWKGLPKFFRSKLGGILLLTLFAAIHFFVPMLTEILFGVCAAAAGLFFFKLVSIFGPSGTLTITREHADGTTSTETRAFYGSSEEAVARAESDLRAEGYDHIRRTG